MTIPPETLSEYERIARAMTDRPKEEIQVFVPHKAAHDFLKTFSPPAVLAMIEEIKGLREKLKERE